MADNMAGSPVVSKLMAVLAATEKAFKLLHDQEHYWEVAKYHKLENWWDVANKDVWEIHHCVLKRLYKLGGRPQGVDEDEVDAFDAALRSFQDLHEVCQAVYDVADEVDDYVTIDKLSKSQATIEAWIVDARARLAQLRKLKPQGFMSEQM